MAEMPVWHGTYTGVLWPLWFKELQGEGGAQHVDVTAVVVLRGTWCFQFLVTLAVFVVHRDCYPAGGFVVYAYAVSIYGTVFLGDTAAVNDFFIGVAAMEAAGQQWRPVVFPVQTW